jgi:hypothetical protein
MHKQIKPFEMRADWAARRLQMLGVWDWVMLIFSSCMLIKHWANPWGSGFHLKLGSSREAKAGHCHEALTLISSIGAFEDLQQNCTKHQRIVPWLTSHGMKKSKLLLSL